VRALLDLMRENEAAVQTFSTQCRYLLGEASKRLTMLDPEHGEEKLITSVAAEQAKLSLPQRQPGALVLCSTPTSPLPPSSPLQRQEIICAALELLCPNPTAVSLSL